MACFKFFLEKLEIFLEKLNGGFQFFSSKSKFSNLWYRFDIIESLIQNSKIVHFLGWKFEINHSEFCYSIFLISWIKFENIPFFKFAITLGISHSYFLYNFSRVKFWIFDLFFFLVRYPRVSQPLTLNWRMHIFWLLKTLTGRDAWQLSSSRRLREEIKEDIYNFRI